MGRSLKGLWNNAKFVSSWVSEMMVARKRVDTHKHGIILNMANSQFSPSGISPWAGQLPCWFLTLGLQEKIEKQCSSSIVASGLFIFSYEYGQYWTVPFNFFHILVLPFTNDDETWLQWQTTGENTGWSRNHTSPTCMWLRTSATIAVGMWAS